MVYVDSPKYRHFRYIMCHMIADTEEELHAMADKIGISRKHFQDKDGRPHYDICKTKRRLAIEHGAIEADTNHIIRILKEEEK